ncbi:MAG: magnesium transporter CorA family protein [Chlamydiota bacterium]
MLTFYHKNPKENSFTSISEPEKECWIHADNATSEDIEKICALTNLHITDLLDALDPYELPRLEIIQDNLLVFARHPIEQDPHRHTMSITILITKDYLITISPSTSALVHNLLETAPNNASSKVSDFFTQILLKISQEFAIQIRQQRIILMNRGKEMNTIDSEDIFSLTKQEETLNQYDSCLELFHTALEKAGSAKFPSLCPSCYREIDDILNSVKQSESLCGNLIKNIRSLRDSYQIIFANKLTKTIKLLTALTIIFSIPTLVASVYGMNVRLPLAGNDHAFALLMLIMFVISTSCGYWFYRKKWM